MKVNGINSTLSSVILFISPAVSGAVLAAASLEATLLIDVVTAVTGVGITASIAIKPHEKMCRGKNSYAEMLGNGFAYLREDPFVKRLLIFQLVILFLISPSAFLTPLMVSRTFGSEVWRLTASEMTYSLGMILGGLLIASWGGFKKKTDTTVLAGFVYGILMIGLGRAPAFWLYLVCNTLIGVTSPCYNAPLTVTIQEEVAPEMQGRVFSFMQAASSCALPLGMVLFGPLADVLKVQNILLTAGLLVAAVSAMAHLTSFLGKTGPH